MKNARNLPTLNRLGIYPEYRHASIARLGYLPVQTALDATFLAFCHPIRGQLANIQPTNLLQVAIHAEGHIRSRMFLGSGSDVPPDTGSDLHARRLYRRQN